MAGLEVSEDLDLSHLTDKGKLMKIVDLILIE